MELVLQKMDYLMSSAKVYFEKAGSNVFDEKTAPQKWSKKEILGHLVDSAINNIQRFTEIQDSEHPFRIKNYNPDQLVKANFYQRKDVGELFQLWQHLNTHIRFLIANQSAVTLIYPIILHNGEEKDFKFLIDDYVEHLEHHLDQIYH